MPIVKLSPAFLAGPVFPPGQRRIEYCDSVVPGLLIEHRSAADSMPTWYWRRKVNGKTAYKNLGPLKDLDLDSARKTVALLKAEHAMKPKDSRSEEAAIGSITLDTFFHDHYLPHAKLHKRSFNRDIQLYARIGPRFGKLALKDISRREVQVFHGELIESGRGKTGLAKATANHHAQLLRHLCSLACSWELLGRNVLKALPLFALDNQVENYLDDEQIERLVQVCQTDPDRDTCVIVLYALATAGRLGEILHAKWADVDEVNKVWRIPASNSKSKRHKSLPLNDSALWVLKQLTSRGKSEWLFPSPVTGAPFVTVTRAWYRLRAKIGLNDKVRFHDLRHSAASRWARAGRSLYEIQRLLSHADPKTTMRYAHLSAKTLLEASNAAPTFLPKVELAAANVDQ